MLPTVGKVSSEQKRFVWKEMEKSNCSHGAACLVPGECSLLGVWVAACRNSPGLHFLAWCHLERAQGVEDHSGQPVTAGDGGIGEGTGSGGNSWGLSPSQWAEPGAQGAPGSARDSVSPSTVSAGCLCLPWAAASGGTQGQLCPCPVGAGRGHCQGRRGQGVAGAAPVALPRDLGNCLVLSLLFCL